MWNYNSGYVGSRMSVRAVAAYEDGEMPLSKWTKQAMLDKIETILKDNNLENMIDEFKKLRAKEIKDRYLVYSSWHHTGKYFNATDFYRIDEDEVLETTVDDILELIKERTPRKSRKNRKKVENLNSERRVKAKWRERNGRRYTIAKGYGTIKGCWFYPDQTYYSKKLVKADSFDILCEQFEFGLKRIVNGVFEKGKYITIYSEGEYYDRYVHKDDEGLYIIIDKERIYENEIRI